MLKVQNLSYAYNDKKVVENVSFQLKEGKSYALMGASGSGKSTLLKLIYGWLDAAEGSVFWKDTAILGPAFRLVPGMPFMKYLAQDFDLMPFVSASENVGRFLSNFYLEEKSNRINELLDLVEMTEFAHVKAKFLSGGQMQRIALARVLALEPEVLLLDEPFSHIDPHQKSKLAQHLFSYCQQKCITVLFTSHTPDEALMFADEILVLQNGKLIEKDTAQHVYELPKNEYIAQLTGEINVIPVRYLGVANDEVLFLRPHQFFIVSEGYEGSILQSYFCGRVYLLKVQFKNIILTMESKEKLSGIIRFLIR